MRHIITEIQSAGVRVSDRISGRNAGAGPAEGRAFIIDDIAVNVPLKSPFVSVSPFELAESDSGFALQKNGTDICTVKIVSEPGFYRFRAKDGTPFSKIALLHGKNCLATTVFQTCVHWKTGQQCAFCGTQLSLGQNKTIPVKSPEQLAETARQAFLHDGITHMTLTSGTSPHPGEEIRYMSECVFSIKKTVDIPVHVQFIPPRDLTLLECLVEAGTDTVGIHAESFDPDVLSRFAPAKAAIGTKQYEAAWKKAVSLFGTGQVSSFLITGLGEAPESVVYGAEYLADLGVYPYIVPLRPIPGTFFSDACPPSSDTMKRIYEKVSPVLKAKGIYSRNSKAGCVRCGACSAIRWYEEIPASTTCHTARNPLELSKAFSIRRNVFVDEQQLFTVSDKDENDEKSIHLVAETGGKIVGTVRLYPDKNGSGRWYGGRLAVVKPHRSLKIASLLVKEAMKRAKKKRMRTVRGLHPGRKYQLFQKTGLVGHL